ncbi:MAG: nicotinamide riboside transporter PnuC [Cytophagales bacterium]|nr:MAG: nicotinamide riboside transporter PnuC [Cytophagales bacterium]
MHSFFSIHHIAFYIGNYPLSYIELIGTLAGLLSVYLASRANFYTWHWGIVNEIAFFLIFYQVRLYADMMLQVYFFITTLYGIAEWRKKDYSVKIAYLSLRWRFIIFCLLLLGVSLMSYVVSQLHLWFAAWFPEPSTYWVADSFVLVASMIANILLVKKKVEAWYFWITVNITSIMLYSFKGIYLIAFEYCIFLLLALYGLWQWHKKTHSFLANSYPFTADTKP